MRITEIVIDVSFLCSAVGRGAKIEMPSLLTVEGTGFQIVCRAYGDFGMVCAALIPLLWVNVTIKSR